MGEADTSLSSQTVSPGEIMTEAEIDETLAASFPASDPPSWTLGTDRRRPQNIAMKYKLDQTNDLPKQNEPEGGRWC
jgi:hypothetical protein